MNQFRVEPSAETYRVSLLETLWPPAHSPLSGPAPGPPRLAMTMGKPPIFRVVLTQELGAHAGTEFCDTCFCDTGFLALAFLCKGDAG